MQPGETITPGTPPTSEQQPEKTEVPTQAPVEQMQQSPLPSTPEPVKSSDSESNWQFTSDNQEAPTPMPQPEIAPVSWTASEYIAHDKGPSWFVAFGLVLFIAVAGLYFITKDLITPLGIAVAGITFGIFAARPPRVLRYTVDSRGIMIEQKFYPYAELKSFDVVDEGQLPAILLMPLKRFLPPITVFYDQQSEEAILNVIGSYLPHQEQQSDAVDRLMRRIRF